MSAKLNHLRPQTARPSLGNDHSRRSLSPSVTIREQPREVSPQPKSALKPIPQRVHDLEKLVSAQAQEIKWLKEQLQSEKEARERLEKHVFGRA